MHTWSCLLYMIVSPVHLIVSPVHLIVSPVHLIVSPVHLVAQRVWRFVFLTSLSHGPCLDVALLCRSSIFSFEFAWLPLSAFPPAVSHWCECGGWWDGAHDRLTIKPVSSHCKIMRCHKERPLSHSRQTRTDFMATTKQSGQPRIQTLLYTLFTPYSWKWGRLLF